MGLADERIYYNDSYRMTFEGVVVEQFQVGNQWHIRLDKTAFYPTSGGQPNDTGFLSGLSVTDVLVEGGQVFHVTNQPLAVGQTVIGTVDWERRFDHMQQHCGHHILSRSFERLYDMDTFGFHLGVERVTIDLRADTLTWDQVEAAERMANQVIWDNRPIYARFVSNEEVPGLFLRHPPKVTDNVRIVTIDGFDDNACGGTHPQSTGQVGQIKVVRMERMHGGTRLTFVCGNRALNDAQTRGDTLRAVGTLLSTGPDEMVEAVQKLQDALQTARKREGELKAKLATLLAAEYVRGAVVSRGGVRVVCTEVVDLGARELKSLVQAMLPYFGDDSFVAAFACVEDHRIHVQIAASRHANLDVSRLLREVLGELGGKGGGTPFAAQGSVPAERNMTAESVVACIRSALCRERFA